MTITEEAPATVAAPEAPEIDGAQVLDEVRNYLGWFATFPDTESLDAVTLWAAHTHAYQAWDTTPRLALLSDEPGSGKSRVLELLSLLCATPELLIRPTAATVFRMIDVEHPTLLFDETDQTFGRAGGAAMADLQAVLNSGYRRGASVPRCQGDTFRKWDVFAPVALAGLGVLPDMIMTRSVVVRLKKGRKAAAAFSMREHGETGRGLGRSLAAWKDASADALGTTWAEIPEGLTDRPRDVWEPLLIVAGIAGGHWPETARKACLSMTRAGLEDNYLTPGMRLLRDIRAVWAPGAASMGTTEVLNALRAVDGSPWAATFGDRLLAPRELSRLLGQYGVSPVKVVIDGRAVQGYKASALRTAFQDVLPIP